MATKHTTSSLRERAALRQIEQFRKLLVSDKFRGTELACSHCGGHKQGDKYQPLDDSDERVTACKDCGGNMREERKDWISTSDVLNWLRNIEDSLKYDMPEALGRN